MIRAERVAFILNDVFGCRFTEVAEITGRSQAACRQLASTARRRVRASQAAAGLASPAGQPRQGLQKAWEAGDIGALIGILDPKPARPADGGGLVTAALRPIGGGEQIARFYAAIVGIALNVTILERMVKRPARPGGPAGQRRDGVRVRHRRRPDQAHLGQYGTLRSSGPGRQADTRPRTAGSAASCPMPGGDSRSDTEIRAYHADNASSSH